MRVINGIPLGRPLALTVVTINFAQTLKALRGGGLISHYEVVVDGEVRRTKDADATMLTVSHLNGSAGGSKRTHEWRVRAVNSLGNAGGWSLPQTFRTSREELMARTE
jgi:hypothetical protein